MRFRCTFWYKIQLSLVISFFKKRSFSYRWKSKSYVEIHKIFINSYENFASISHSDQVIMYLSWECISRILYRGFSASIWPWSIFIAAGRSLWSSSFKSKLSALNFLSQLRMVIIVVVSFLVNNTNLPHLRYHFF